MDSTRQLEVKTIFSADAPKRAPVRSAVPAAVSSVRLIALLSLAASVAWVYTVWFPIDRRFQKEMIKTVLVLPTDMSFLFDAPPADLANPAPPEETEADAPGVGAVVDAEESDAASSKFEATLTRLNGAMYAWLALTTAVACWLALCAGAGLSGWGRGPLRSTGLLIAFGAALFGLSVAYAIWTQGSGRAPLSLELSLVGLPLLSAALFALVASGRGRGWGVLFVVGVLSALAALAWHRYESGFPMIVTRSCMVLLAVLAVLIGTLLGRQARVLQTAAVPLVLLASAVTVAAFAYASRTGAFAQDPPTLVTYAKAFGLQSSFAWLVLVVRGVAR
jgi:hypothetical protein